jgi:hypothetical protein
MQRVRVLALSSALVVALVVALVLVAAPAAPAQCFGPDGLEIGPCCAQTIANVPQFPSAAVPGLGICWSACNVAGTQNVRVDWTTPRQASCGEYDTLLTVSDSGSGAPLLTGKLVLDYTRTWLEVDPAGGSQQVWRFAAKADLFTVPGVPPLCPVPTCLPSVGTQPTAFFYGYVDYASCSAAGPWENVLVLYHACDRFIHAPGLSDRPGVFHPGGSFGIVAPHSPPQPFLPTNLVASGGPLVAEATRANDTSTPPPTLCLVEDPVAFGNMLPLGSGCICSFTPLPKHQTLRRFSGTTTCVNAAGIPGGWTSLDILFPTLPWKHMVTSSIGCWANPLAYPGTECAWVDEGLFVQQDACTGDVLEMKYGGSTRGGWTALLLPTPAIVGNFTDIADNYTAPLSGPYPTPILGSIRPTDRLIYVNEP